MKWMRFKVRTRALAEDILVSSMQDIGLYGAQIEDHVPLTAVEKEQMFVDILPEAEPDDGSAVLSFFVEETLDGKLLIDEEEKTPEEVKEAMEAEIATLKTYSDEIGEGTVTVEETEDVDWINNWKQYFHQFWVDDVLVIPSWETPLEEDKKPLLTFHIDPGTAFGTGMHETTQLCIRQIRKYLTPETVMLDVGTGSGILSILSLMLGAKKCVGTDLDPCAEPAVAENLEANHVDAENFKLILGNLIGDAKTQATVQEMGPEGGYDIVVANILPDVLLPLTPEVVPLLKKDGVYITSGIIDGREDSVAKAMEEAGLEVVEITAQGEWRSVTGIKRA